MKKLFLPTLAALMLLGSFVYTSCKKTTNNSTYPTPANNRIMSYSKFTNSPANRPVNENFQFFYDGQQRVTQILYTTNDSVKVSSYIDWQTITFTYSGDSIYKTYTATRTKTIIEQDTLVQNVSSGLITDAYIPGFYNHYTYYGKLIASNTLTAYDSGTSIFATSTYTSDNADLLNRTYDGSLQATFPSNDSGVQWIPYYHDTALSLPLTVTWSTFGPALTTTVHTANTYSDQISGNTGGYAVSIDAVEPNGVVLYNHGVTWPGGLYPRESYFVYPALPDRPGDYLQIESFTQYGVNIFQNAHLVKQIVDENGPIANVSYTIDANSKITQTFVYGVAYADTVIYKFQYETD